MKKIMYKIEDPHENHSQFKKEFFHHAMSSMRRPKLYMESRDGNLFVQTLLPGIIKDTIKIRAKPMKLEITATFKDEVKLFPHKEAHKVIELSEEVIPDEAKAEYSDGILTVTFPLVNPGHEVTDIN
ncbi:MAG: hypothetical protein HeimC2_00950 [Candidatus Heimdallarchaeota archaeon LC_2]|nr:MAG: hypothetical protein HeimC2_00950 [Candidatus Heimdallarchaeota archaeon LC_2]